MKKRNGFTLIELLAVVVILAVIALISTPLIINIINDAKEGAFQNTAYGIAQAAEYEFMQSSLNGEMKGDLLFVYNNSELTTDGEEVTLDYKGERPKDGVIIVNNEGKTFITVHNGQYCATKDYDTVDVIVEKKNKEDCLNSARIEIQTVMENQVKQILTTIGSNIDNNPQFDPETVNETNINNLLNLPVINYESLKITMKDDEPTISLIGKNNFENLSAIGTVENVQIYDKLYLWYDFTSKTNSDPTKATASDLSGQNNNGTLIDFDYTSSSGWLTDSVNFDGTNDAIAIPWKPGDNYTISIWFYKSAFGSDSYETLVGGPSGFELEAKPSSNNVAEIQLYSWGGYRIPYLFNQWNHVVFVRTPKNTKLYLNGVLKQVGLAGALPQGQYFLGAWSVSGSQNYKGKINDVVICNSAWSEAEVLKKYDRGINL